MTIFAIILIYTAGLFQNIVQNCLQYWTGLAYKKSSLSFLDVYGWHPLPHKTELQNFSAYLAAVSWRVRDSPPLLRMELREGGH